MAMSVYDEQQADPDIRSRIARIDRFLDERARWLRAAQGVPVSSLVGLVALMCTGAGLFAAGATFMTLIR